MIALSEQRLRLVLAWLVVVLLAVPVGGALWLGVAHGESPCILCWSQRTSMMLIALVALFVVRYGPRPRYLGMLLLLCGWGMFMALRHSALHLARDVGQGFSGSILGAHTYVWAFVIHWVVLLVSGVLLLLMRGPLSANADIRPGRAGRFAMALLVFMAAGNAGQALISTGPPPNIGQADPVRLSLNPRYWVRTNEELEGRISWRGGWTIPKPDPFTLDPDPSHGPLAGLPVVTVQRWLRISPALNGRLTDFATDAQGRAVAVTDRYGVYLLDSTLTRVLQHVVLDPGFSVDMSPLAGATFMGDTAIVLSTNKSYAMLRADSAADSEAEWRHFLETSGAVTELKRSRFATVRARQQYVLSLAFDSAARELVTISVPSPRHPRVVVSRFDAADFMLSSEFLPVLDEAFTRRDSTRTLAEYTFTGASVSNGRLYAISAAYSTVVVIDLASNRVIAAFAVNGITRPVGLAVKGNELLIAQSDGRIGVVENRIQ